MYNTIARLTTILAGITLVGAAQTSRAELLAYEGFDYVAGESLLGQSAASGYGFSTGWIGQSGGVVNNSIVRAGSFTYSDAFGNTTANTGNRALVTGNGTDTGDNTGGTTGSANPWRHLSSYRGTDAVPSTTWFSVIATVTSPAYPYTNSLGNVANHGRAVSPLQLFYNGTVGSTGQGSEMFGVGRGTETTSGIDQTHIMDSWGLINRGSAAQETTSSVNFTILPPDFLLLRIDHNPGTDPRVSGAADTAYLWINPSNLAVEPNIATADLTFSPGAVDANNDRDYVFNVIRLFGGGFNTTVGYGAVELDELKIGTEFLDVTLRAIPEPSILALGLGGAVALFASRRRKA